MPNHKSRFRSLFPWANGESGNAFLELSLFLPMLITLLIGIIDLSRALNQYQVLSRVAYEGSRFAAGIAGLETGCFGNPSTRSDCSSSYPVFQSRVQSRVETLISRNRLGTPSELVTEFVRETGALSNSVRVRIRLPYVPILLRDMPIDLTVEATAPYLHVNGGHV